MVSFQGKVSQYMTLIQSCIDESLLRLKKIQAIKRPTERAQRNLYKLISNTQSLVTDEADWIREGPDLAALGTTNEHGWLNTFLEDLLSIISKKVTMVRVCQHWNDFEHTRFSAEESALTG